LAYNHHGFLLLNTLFTLFSLKGVVVHPVSRFCTGLIRMPYQGSEVHMQ
jgi:hypothetical protein